MRKITSHLKKHKKSYLLGTIGFVAVIAGGLALTWDCLQFHYYCKEKELCQCAERTLSKQEKKAFVAIAKYMKKTQKATLDAGILKYATAEQLSEVGLKMKACSADVARRAMLENNARNRKNFPGDNTCMRHVLMNDLSNEEVLFLKSPISKNVQALKNPQIREMYITTSGKLMKCMNEDIQKQYQIEIEKINQENRPTKKRVRKKAVPQTQIPATAENPA